MADETTESKKKWRAYYDALSLDEILKHAEEAGKAAEHGVRVLYRGNLTWGPPRVAWIIQQPDPWTDPTTGLMWATMENGEDVNWREANRYSQSLRLGGYSDWRLPTIDELEGIYEPDGKVGSRNTKGGIKVDGSQWSRTGKMFLWAWVFNFTRGERRAVIRTDELDNRVLCVRRPVKGAVQAPQIPGAWTDPATGLMWAKHDNGSDVNWKEADGYGAWKKREELRGNPSDLTWDEAQSYCRNLSVGGFTEWRLPTIGELKGRAEGPPRPERQRVRLQHQRRNYSHRRAMEWDRRRSLESLVLLQPSRGAALH
jgi:hypothetical protein